MSTLATLTIAAALIALTARIGRSRRGYGTDPVEPLTFPERARRRGGRVYFGCWRVA